MKLRVIDYRQHTGGGKRFFIQLLHALQQCGGIDELEFVSHGSNIQCVRQLFVAYGIRASVIDIAYTNPMARMGILDYCVPDEALQNCDVAWLPWVHLHRLPENVGPGVVGSFHDALAFTEATLALPYPGFAARARETVRQWVNSSATIICSSHFSTTVLKEIFGCPTDRFKVATLSGHHAQIHTAEPAVDNRWPWLASPFILCPANISGHKNHEFLFEGYAASSRAWPLVLTGAGSDLINRLPPGRRILRRAAVAVGLRPPHRADVLRKKVERLGLAGGGSLVPLGNLSDAQYDAVLDRASCVVMPTLGEGGGSFPVEEALIRGKPVICSDIPVLREHMARLGAEVIWVDPRQPKALAACLNELVADFSTVQAAALAQRGRLRSRAWVDVAADYMQVFEEVAIGRHAMQGAGLVPASVNALAGAAVGSHD